ncbi:MAG: helix-turn-helix transcriptional regulator [Phascolarctobacterium sp.]|nr:helix-turn-helix transcriptional regulator [Candidatus Phascolarctobacterium caballi]
MNLSSRQMQIAEIVRIDGPITGEQIASRLHVTRAALRSDLAILIMGGILDARPKVGYFYTGKNTLGMLMEEISSILVADIQSVPVAVSVGATAKDVIFKMFTEDVGSVYVVDESGLLAGVVSRKDLLKFALNNKADLAEIPVELAMTQVSKIIYAEPSDSVVSAACKLIDNEIDSLPVVKIVDVGKHSFTIVGRITKTNFTRLLVELAEGKGVHHDDE